MSALKRFSNIGDADFPGVLMASVGPAVRWEGIVDNPDVFVAAAWRIFLLVPAHFPPDIVGDTLSDNFPFPELAVKQIGGTAASAVNDCIDESRHTGVFADSRALVQKVSPGTDGILPFLFADPEVSGERRAALSGTSAGGQAEDRFAGQLRVSGEFVLARVDLREFVIGGGSRDREKQQRQKKDELFHRTSTYTC